MSSNLDTTPVTVELSTGASLPLRPIAAKTGNIYHAVLKSKKDGTRYNPGKYGVKCAPSVVGGSLPTSAKVNGRAINGTPGTTTSGNIKVTFKADLEIDGQARKLSLQISKLPDGNFNVSGVLNRPGSGSNGAATSSL